MNDSEQHSSENRRETFFKHFANTATRLRGRKRPNGKNVAPRTGFTPHPRKESRTKNKTGQLRDSRSPQTLDTRTYLQRQYFAETEPYFPNRRDIYPASVSAWAPAKRDPRAVLNRWFHILSFHYPARLTVGIFSLLIAAITLLLMLPPATPRGVRVSSVDAFFTAVSAVCVTGLTVVNTATQWSTFGQAVILAGIILGGLGVMTLASLLALIVSRRLGLTQRLLVQSDTQSRIGETTSVIWGVVVTTVIATSALFLLILPSFLRSSPSPSQASWDAFFTAVSTFNNAGFINFEEGLHFYRSNWCVLIPLTLGTFVGAMGFPVIVDLQRNWRNPRILTIHTKLTLSTYLLVAFVTATMVVAIEWNNSLTFGDLEFSDKILNGVLWMISPRSVGITAVDVSAMTDSSLLITDVSMFVGGGSGSHAGGIKVTTFAVLLLAAWAEVRGRRDVQVFHRRIPHTTVRQAVAVLLAGAILVLSATVILSIITPFTLDQMLFEVTSAFGTVGLSTGITPLLSVSAKLLIIFLMLVGRIGPMTLAAALALKERGDAIRMPDARPIVG